MKLEPNKKVKSCKSEPSKTAKLKSSESYSRTKQRFNNFEVRTSAS